MERATATFDEGRGIWTIAPTPDADAAAPNRQGAPIAMLIGGLRWSVSNLNHTTSWEAEVDAHPTAWARQALDAIVGTESTAIIDGGPGRSGDSFELDDTAGWQRAAMGMLTVATAEPSTFALHPIDRAALLHRAGLDRLEVPLAGAEEFADDALAAWELLPEALHQALEGDAPRGRGVCWQIARSGLSDAARFIYAVTGEQLPHLDVDAVFEMLTRELTDELADAAHAFAFRGDLGVEPKKLHGYVVDTDIRGVVGCTGEFTPDQRIVEVTLVSRLMTTHVGTTRLSVRIAGPGITDAAPVRFKVAETPAGPRLVAEIQVPDGADPSWVEVLTDPRQPELTLGIAQQIDRQCEMLEGQRLLRQLGATMGDARQSVTHWRQQIAVVLTRGVFADLPSGFEPEAIPLPSDGALGVLGDIAEEVLDEVRAISDPAQRAATAHNVAHLAAPSALPSVQELAGDMSMLEVDARNLLGNRARGSAIDAANRAELSYFAADKSTKAMNARRVGKELRGASS